ncbi:MAG TPA: hypothetical protein VML55_16600 [Planctomycetaceae bacterium]|nr:hypothetical protein [Planctomycetaceae bacterium]
MTDPEDRPTASITARLTANVLLESPNQVERPVEVESAEVFGSQDRPKLRLHLRPYGSEARSGNIGRLASESEWPRTAAALRQIAQHYEQDARREDDEAVDRATRATRPNVAPASSSVVVGFVQNPGGRGCGISSGVGSG